MDLDGTVAFGRKYFHESDMTFSVTVAGQQFYVMTSPLNISKALNSLQVFNYDKPIRHIMQKFGISEHAIQLAYQKPTKDFTSGKSRREGSSPGLRSMAEAGSILLKRQLLPGDNYHAFATTFLGQIEQRMHWNTISKKAIVSGVSPTAVTRSISLLNLVRHTIIESTTVSFLGPAILNDSTIMENFIHFDERLWMFLYNVPRPWSSSTLSSMKKVQRSMSVYLGLPLEKRPGAAWLVNSLEAEMRATGIDEWDIAGWLTMILWVLNTNTWRLCFWVVAYSVRDPTLLATIQDEVSSATTHAKSVCSLHDELLGCRLLNSVYHEVLRLVDSPISIRELTQPATSALGEPLPAGATLLLAHRQLLTSKKAWGPDALDFNPKRFLGNESLLKSKNYTPFGGGRMLCPGQVMSRGEILVFLALLIHRFKVTATGKFPGVDIKSGVGTGILGLKHGDDYMLQLTMKDNE